MEDSYNEAHSHKVRVLQQTHASDALHDYVLGFAVCCFH